MSLPPAEERKLQHAKLNELRYMAFLLERLVWHTAPGAQEFGAFRVGLTKAYFDSKQIPDEVA